MCLIFIGLILIGTDLIGFIPQWSKGTIYAHGGQCSGLKESFLFLEIVYFLFLGGSEAAMGAQSTVAHSWPNPTSNYRFYFFS